MSGTQGTLMTAHDDVQLLAWELTRVSGALKEIETTWRRAQACRPDLPLGLPQRLADTALLLAIDARSLAAAGPKATPSLIASVAGQMSKLNAGVSYARVMTCGPGAASVGDAELWEFLESALHEAGAQLEITAPSAR